MATTTKKAPIFEQAILDQLMSEAGYKNHRIVEYPAGPTTFNYDLQWFNNRWVSIQLYERKANALKAAEKQLAGIYRGIQL